MFHFAQSTVLDGSICCAIHENKVFAKKIDFLVIFLDLAVWFKICIKNGQMNTTKSQKIFKMS